MGIEGVDGGVGLAREAGSRSAVPASRADAPADMSLAAWRHAPCCGFTLPNQDLGLALCASESPGSAARADEGLDRAGRG